MGKIAGMGSGFLGLTFGMGQQAVQFLYQGCTSSGSGSVTRLAPELRIFWIARRTPRNGPRPSQV
jgi:hypothetical protein